MLQHLKASEVCLYVLEMPEKKIQVSGTLLGWPGPGLWLRIDAIVERERGIAESVKVSGRGYLGIPKKMRIILECLMLTSQICSVTVAKPRTNIDRLSLSSCIFFLIFWYLSTRIS